MTVASTSPHSSRFAHSTRVAISHLRPPSDAQSHIHIRAAVVLVWPYSSSTRALSLLLAEPDVRLRKGKGQVKVTFHGRSAEAVAKGQVGIGDTVQLGLEGAQWIQSSEDVSTPGKKIEWDLMFDGIADLDVKRNSQTVATITVDPSAPETVTVDPSRPTHIEASPNGSGPTQYLWDANSWSSPIFVKGKRLSSGSFFDTSSDPFTDYDGFVIGKGRKRTKFARNSDSWRLLDRTPSPEKDNGDLRLEDVNGLTGTATLHSQPSHDVEVADEQPVDGAPFDLMSRTTSTVSGDSQSLLHLPALPHSEIVPHGPGTARDSYSPVQEAGQMQPPTTPRRIPHASDTVTGPLVAPNEIATPARSELETPRLGPIPSPGLPLVSPLIKQAGLHSGNFSESLDSPSILDANGNQQQTLPVSEATFASSTATGPSSDIGQRFALSAVEAEQPRTPEAETDTRETLFEIRPAADELSPQLDRPLRTVSWPSFHEEVQQTHVMPHGPGQVTASADAFDFEFLNTSPVEAHNEGQNMWNLPETSAGSVATIEAPKDNGLLDLAGTLDEPADLPGVDAHGALQHHAPIHFVSDVLSESDTSGRLLGRTTQDENVSAISGSAPVSSSRLPIDPSIATRLGAAAVLVTSRKDNTQLTEALPEQASDSRTWRDKLDVSAVDAESQHVYTAPPFLFQQRWHRRPSSQRSRRSSQYASLDGASDEGSADGSAEVEHISDGSHRFETLHYDNQNNDGIECGKNAQESNAPLLPPSDDDLRNQITQVPSKDVAFPHTQAPDSSPIIVVLNSSDEDNASGGQQESTAQDGIARPEIIQPEEQIDIDAVEPDDLSTESHMNTVRVRELEADHVKSQSLPPILAHDEPSTPAIDVKAEIKATEKDADLALVNRQAPTKTSPNLQGEQRRSPQPQDEVLKQELSHQLVTPENTQQERGDLQLQGHTAELGRVISLPPTPQNTQEDADIPQSTVENRDMAEKGTEVLQIPKMALSTSLDDSRERRRSPRLSRKFPLSQEVTEVVSPYFTPKRTSRMRAQDQPVKPDRPLVLPIGQSSPAAVDDTIHVVQEESKPNDFALQNEELAPRSSPTVQPKSGLTTSLSYYTPLSLLDDHFSQTVDVLALATTTSTEPQEAISGPKDWHTTLHLTEPSLQGNKTITAQIFRPHKEALPKVQRGGLLLLRDFKVQGRKRKCMLLSNESSAWAVFSVRREMDGPVSDVDAVVVGPPVEYGSEEKSRIIELEKWWRAVGDGQHPSQAQADRTNKAMLAAKNGGGGELTHELRDGTAYKDEQKGNGHLSISASYHELRDSTLYKDETRSKLSDPNAMNKLNEDTLVLHELRDGTVYRDDTPSRPRRDGRRRSISTPGEISLRNADTMATQENEAKQDSQDANNSLESVDAEVAAEADSGDESSINEAVSSQIYHELRNGRRYADPAHSQQYTEQRQHEDGQDEDESVIHELRDGVTYTDE